jgi:uncharacterized protein YcnI
MKGTERSMRTFQQLAIITTVLTVAMSTASAQIDLVPKNAQPTIWERFALRVLNTGEPATVDVRLVIPEVVAILGVHAPSSAWEFEVIGESSRVPSTSSRSWDGSPATLGARNSSFQ